MIADCQCVVVGAGVVGLAIAAELAAAGVEVVVLERESSFGTMTSARNSEVIHAGIYYPAGSLKARLCVDGRAALYRYCRQRHVAHQRCGKLIVATNAAQAAQLVHILGRASANGVDDLQHLSAEQAMNMEPELQCVSALYSPSTGIIDSHGLMLALLGDAERHGAVLATRTPVERLRHDAATGLFTVQTAGDHGMRLVTRMLVNAAGHQACALAAGLLHANPASHLLPQSVLSKGNYFRLLGASPFSRLIYPVPEQGGLGVHLTIDLAGKARFGPDVQAVESEDYTVDPLRANSFYAAVRAYWPALEDGALLPDYAGIRPKIRFGASVHGDFVIQSHREHGLPGLVNLFGIESPGLTASLAVAEEVRRLIMCT